MVILSNYNVPADAWDFVEITCRVHANVYNKILNLFKCPHLGNFYELITEISASWLFLLLFAADESWLTISRKYKDI